METSWIKPLNCYLLGFVNLYGADADEMKNKHELWLELTSFSVIDLSDMSHKPESLVLYLRFSWNSLSVLLDTEVAKMTDSFPVLLQQAASAKTIR